MPNWCNTIYTIAGSKRAVDKIAAAVENSRYALGKQNMNPWLVPILVNLGLPEKRMEKCRNGRNYRGYVYNVERPDKESIKLYCDTAWSESDGFRHELLKKFRSIDISYTAVECGCGVFCTNDDGVAGDYYVESNESGFYSEDEAIKSFADLMPDKKIKTMDDVRKAIAEHNAADDVDEIYVCEEMEYCEN